MQAGAARAASSPGMLLCSCWVPSSPGQGGDPAAGTPTWVAPLPSTSPPLSVLDFCSDRCSSSQHRGLVVVADRTELLYQQGYWASYNVP